MPLSLLFLAVGYAHVCRDNQNMLECALSRARRSSRHPLRSNRAADGWAAQFEDLLAPADETTRQPQPSRAGGWA